MQTNQPTNIKAIFDDNYMTGYEMKTRWTDRNNENEKKTDEIIFDACSHKVVDMMI